METMVKENRQFLQELLNSMQVGLDRAKKGSEVEDTYVRTKAMHFINTLGLEIKGSIPTK